VHFQLALKRDMNENQITREVPKHIILEVNNRSLYPHKDINKIRKCITREEKGTFHHATRYQNWEAKIGVVHPNPPRHLVPPHCLMVQNASCVASRIVVTPYSCLLGRHFICESVAGGKLVCSMKRRATEKEGLRIVMNI
jgi:hypothetical protein